MTDWKKEECQFDVLCVGGLCLSECTFVVVCDSTVLPGRSRFHQTYCEPLCQPRSSPRSGPAWLYCYHRCPNMASPGGWVGGFLGAPGGGFGTARQAGGSWGDKDCAADCGFMMPSGTSVAIRLHLTAARMALRLSLRNPVMVWVGLTLTAGLCETGRGIR